MHNLDLKDNSSLKTLGSQAARLVTILHERRRRVFTLADVTEITRLRASSARSFMRMLVARSVASRLRPGLFILVPFELGAEREYLGNPYVVARALAGKHPYFLSHASAMDIHGMVTQPQLIVYVTSPNRLYDRTVLGTEFRFVRCKPSHLFGTMRHWVDKQEQVTVSDLERTVLDGLRQPEYCGGITEVAKGLWIRRAEMQPSRLVNYVLQLGVGAVMRRLGYLMETYRIGASRDMERLRRRLTGAYALLDPLLPREGKFLSRWRLQLNVPPEELQAIIGT